MSASTSQTLLVGPMAGEVYAVPERAYVLIGRADACDVVVLDPRVSRRHAALRRLNGEDWLEDVGSRGGTSVNGAPLARSKRLADGDQIRLAGHPLEYRRAAPAAPEPVAVGAAGVQFDVKRQKAAMINNVGQNQYLSYVAHVQQQRDSFARDIAATKTKASWFAWIGLAISVVGFVVYAQVILRFLAVIFESISSGKPPDLTTLGTGPGGVAGIAIGFLAVVVGVVILTVGIVMHVIAAARRRRVDQELPLPPPPWAASTDRSRG